MVAGVHHHSPPPPSHKAPTRPIPPRKSSIDKDKQIQQQQQQQQQFYALQPESPNIMDSLPHLSTPTLTSPPLTPIHEHNCVKPSPTTLDSSSYSSSETETDAPMDMLLESIDGLISELFIPSLIMPTPPAPPPKTATEPQQTYYIPIIRAGSVNKNTRMLLSLLNKDHCEIHSARMKMMLQPQGNKL